MEFNVRQKDGGYRVYMKIGKTISTGSSAEHYTIWFYGNTICEANVFRSNTIEVNNGLKFIMSGVNELQEYPVKTPIAGQIDYVLTANGNGFDWATPSSNTIVKSKDANLITITNNDTVGINTNYINIGPVRLGKNIGQISTTESVLIGEYCGYNIIDHQSFTLIGGYAGYKSEAASYELNGHTVGIGAYSLYKTGGRSFGGQNVAVGDHSLSYNEGENVAKNTAVGFEAMKSMEEGNKCMNTAVGWRAGKGAGSHNDCVYIGATQGSTNNSSADGHASRLMIGNQHHTLLDGKMNADAPQLKIIAAGHIELEGTLPTKYSSTYPNRIWSDNGVLRVGDPGAYNNLGFYSQTSGSNIPTLHHITTLNTLA